MAKSKPSFPRKVWLNPEGAQKHHELMNLHPLQEHSFENSLFWNLFPSSSRYVAPTRPVNVFEFIKNPTPLTQSPFILVRDGAYLLFQFFLQHPRPLSKKMFWLIHASAAAVVPKPWQPQCLFWQYAPRSLVTRGIHQDLPRTRFFLHVKAGSDFLPLNTPESTLNLVRKSAQELGINHFHLILDQPIVTLHRHDRAAQLAHSYHLFQQLEQALEGAQLTLCSPQTFLNEKHLQDAVYFHFNEDNLIYRDDFLSFAAASREATLLQPALKSYSPRDFHGVDQLPVSPFHVVEILTPTNSEFSSFNDFQLEFERNSFSHFSRDSLSHFRKLFLENLKNSR